MARTPKLEGLAAEEAGDIALLARHPVNWLPEHCFIRTKAGDLAPLVPNQAQMVVLRVIALLQAQKKPVRLIILKARQEGITTLGTALQFCWCNLSGNRNALISAHDDESSTEIFRKFQMYQEHCPVPLPVRYSSRKEIVYRQPHYSQMRVHTAGNENLGRGTTLNYLHASELAFWDNASATLTSVLQTVPQDNPDTCVILESTANGMGGEFYERWQRAIPYQDLPYITMCRAQSNYLGIFLPWHTFPDYRAKVMPGFVRTEEEEELARMYGLDDGQLTWRRNKIADECGGDLDLFHQEYPSSDQESFLVSGRPFFAAGRLHEMEKKCREPERRDRGLEIWETPVAGRLYAIGADVAEGKQPDAARDPDASSAHVIDVAARRIVAKLKGQFDPDIFAERLYQLGKDYNGALLGPEVNGTMGGAVREVLKLRGYWNLYHPQRKGSWQESESPQLGWKTDRVSRGIMLGDLQKAVREGWLEVPSRDTIHELRMFVWDSKGKPQAQPGEHDDDVISLAITLQLAIFAAGHATMENYVLSARANEAKRPRSVEAFSVHKLARTGAVDTCEDVEEGVTDETNNRFVSQYLAASGLD